MRDRLGFFVFISFFGFTFVGEVVVYICIICLRYCGNRVSLVTAMLVVLCAVVSASRIVDSW